MRRELDPLVLRAKSESGKNDECHGVLDVIATVDEAKEHSARTEAKNPNPCAEDRLAADGSRRIVGK